MKLHVDSVIRLNNDYQIPRLGLGVFQVTAGQFAKNLIIDAFRCGYRHIDTAKVYGNERTVGEAVRQCGIPRDDIFVTTKLWNSDQGFDTTISAFNESLKQLGLDYIDLYLIHWPLEDGRVESWRAIETLYEKGNVRSIGVSNFMIDHLEELIEQASIVPALNQIELHPYNYQYRKDLVDFCKHNGIRIEAYSPLTRGYRLSDQKLVKMAKKYGKTSAQILIRWSLQKDFIVIPKSANIDRVKENSDVFDFSMDSADVEEIDSYNEDLIVCWDPAEVK